jgi:adenosylhomocysteine nucleosidase
MVERAGAGRHWLLLAAMDEEEEAVLEVLKTYPAREWELSPRAGVRGRLFELGDGRRLGLLRTGIGGANAVLATSLACESSEETRPDAIVLLGVGGALVPELEIGELVVARKVLQHDSLCTFDSGDFLMRSGDLVLTAEQARACDPILPAHAGLVDWLMAEFPDARPGTLVSGGEFAGRTGRKSELASLAPDAILVDMEGAGVAWTAARYGVPFVVAKTVADRLEPDGTIGQDFVRCLRSSAGHAAVVARRIAQGD